MDVEWRSPSYTSAVGIRKSRVVMLVFGQKIWGDGSMWVHGSNPSEENCLYRYTVVRGKLG
jgi:hypothetical protein